MKMLRVSGGLANVWWIAVGLIMLLYGCSNKEPMTPVERDESMENTPTAQGNWEVPGLVDQTGEPIEVPKPGLASGKTLNVTDYGADPNPDSEDDAVAIRAALDAAEPGDQVLIPAGIYDLNSTDPNDETANIVLKNEVDLRGEGQEKTVLITSFDGLENSKVIQGKGVHDVIVGDFTITSRYDGPLGNDTDDKDVGGGPMYGVYIGTREGQPSFKVLVENLGIRKFERHGISVKASREVTLTGNEIGEATAVGPGGQGYGIAIEGSRDQDDPNAINDSRHNVVIGNTLNGKHLRHAILLQFPTHNNLVAENMIVGSHLDAIDLHGEGEYLNEIRDNTIIGSQRAGIALGNSGGSKNKHDASGWKNWVHSNKLIGNKQGILVILGTPNTIIENNRIIAGEDADVGIELRNAPGTEVFRNYITGGDEGFWAIRLKEDSGADGRGKGIPSDIQISCNIIRQAGGGLRIDAGKNLSVIDNIVDGIDGDELRVADEVEMGQLSHQSEFIRAPGELESSQCMIR